MKKLNFNVFGYEIYGYEKEKIDWVDIAGVVFVILAVLFTVYIQFNV